MYVLLILEIIIFIFLLILIILFPGLKIFIKSSKEKEVFKAQINIKWLFIEIFSRKYENKLFKIESKKSKNYKKSDKIKKLLPLLKDNLSLIFDFLISFINSITIEKLNIHVILGFHSPVDTVVQTGYIWTIFYPFNLMKRFNLSVEPNFREETIDFKGEILFKINLLKLLRSIGRKSIITIIWKLRRIYS